MNLCAYKRAFELFPEHFGDDELYLEQKYPELNDKIRPEDGFIDVDEDEKSVVIFTGKLFIVVTPGSFRSYPFANWSDDPTLPTNSIIVINDLAELADVWPDHVPILKKYLKIMPNSALLYNQYHSILHYFIKSDRPCTRLLTHKSFEGMWLGTNTFVSLDLYCHRGSSDGLEYMLYNNGFIIHMWSKGIHAIRVFLKKEYAIPLKVRHTALLEGGCADLPINTPIVSIISNFGVIASSALSYGTHYAHIRLPDGNIATIRFEPDNQDDVMQAIDHLGIECLRDVPGSEG